MKRALFIDRDGTIIVEPPVDFQVDTLAKLEFVPGVISALGRLSKLDYELVMATNQDGLGTDSFPEEDFWTPHKKMLTTLAGEGIFFDDQLIDPTFEHELSPTRKPQTGMFGKYLSGEYDLAESYVIGDRATDVHLAHNLGAKAILLQSREQGEAMLQGKEFAEACVLITPRWAEVAEYLSMKERSAVVVRKTSETDIKLSIDLDGGKESLIDTGLKFFDHMLYQIPHHAGVSLSVECKGDLEVDEHHTIEDVAIVLGEALKRALGDKRGIERYGFVLPMDESRAMVLLDLGGRADFVWRVEFSRERVGDVPTEMFKHFFKSLSAQLSCNLHIEAQGENNHHLIEGVFKAFARALRMAIRRDPFKYELPSSKGVL